MNHGAFAEDVASRSVFLSIGAIDICQRNMNSIICFLISTWAVNTQDYCLSKYHSTIDRRYPGSYLDINLRYSTNSPRHSQPPTSTSFLRSLAS